MKKYLAILTVCISLTAFTAFTALNTIWKNDPMHSGLGFIVKHIGINDVSGTFDDFNVIVNATKPDFSDATFELTAKVASIDTHVTPRDNDLKSDGFFDAEKYPELTFKSTNVKSVGKNKFKVTGDLTMHGITKSVTLDALYRGTVENPMNKKQTAGFQVIGIIKRSDFHIGDKYNDAMISEDVRIIANGEFAQ